jgi:hypothetical protein
MPTYPKPYNSAKSLKKKRVIQVILFY